MPASAARVSRGRSAERRDLKLLRPLCMILAAWHLADWLLARALERRATRMGEAVPALAPLDDRAELAANEVMTKRLS